MAAGLATPQGTVAQTATNLVCQGCVGKKDIAKQAVTAKHFRESSVKANRLANSAKPSGLDYASGEQSFALSTVQQVVRSVTVTAPVAGRVMVLASWTIFEDTPSFTICTVTTDVQVELPHAIQIQTTADLPYMPASAVRSFDVPAGDTTFNLVCKGSAAAETVLDSSMTGVFVPGIY